MDADADADAAGDAGRWALCRCVPPARLAGAAAGVVFSLVIFVENPPLRRWCCRKFEEKARRGAAARRARQMKTRLCARVFASGDVGPITPTFLASLLQRSWLRTTPWLGLK
ncbi:hypothetical protein FB451DRAFT_1212836 [Mycena latifolia]|nr:hypothetical protein FB451DRAFT_1212836 [Mycena latifolia]